MTRYGTISIKLLLGWTQLIQAWSDRHETCVNPITVCNRLNYAVLGKVVFLRNWISPQNWTISEQKLNNFWTKIEQFLNTFCANHLSEGCFALGRWVEWFSTNLKRRVYHFKRRGHSLIERRRSLEFGQSQLVNVQKFTVRRRGGNFGETCRSWAFGSKRRHETCVNPITVYNRLNYAVLGKVVFLRNWISPQNWTISEQKLNNFWTKIEQFLNTFCANHLSEGCFALGRWVEWFSTNLKRRVYHFKRRGHSLIERRRSLEFGQSQLVNVQKFTVRRRGGNFGETCLLDIIILLDSVPSSVTVT